MSWAVSIRFVRKGISGEWTGSDTRVMSHAERATLASMLNGTQAGSRQFDPLIPLFWKITSAGTVSVLSDAYRGDTYIRLASCESLRWFELTEVSHSTPDGDCAHSQTSTDARL